MHRPPDKIAKWKIIFVISQQKHILRLILMDLLNDEAVLLKTKTHVQTE